MKMIIQFIISIITLSCLVACSTHYSSSSSFTPNKEKILSTNNIDGQWVVREILDFAPVIPLDEAEIKSLLGKVLVIKERLVSFLDFKCETAELKHVLIQSDRFFRDYKIVAPDYLPKSLNTFNIFCNGEESNEFSPIIIQQNFLLIIWQGTLVKLVRK